MTLSVPAVVPVHPAVLVLAVVVVVVVVVVIVVAVVVVGTIGNSPRNRSSMEPALEETTLATAAAGVEPGSGIVLVLVWEH